MKQTLVIFLMATAFGKVVAQEQLRPLPTGPIPAVPQSAQWTVTISQDGPALAGSPDSTTVPKAEPSARSTVIKVTKQNNIRKLVIQRSDGGKQICWCIGNSEYAYQDDGTWYQVGVDGSDLIAEYAVSNFPECRNVISPQNYTAVATVNGAPCFVFSAAVETLSSSALAEMNQEMPPGKQHLAAEFSAQSKVAVDMKSLLPLQVHEGSFTTTYQYFSAPENLQVPPSLLATIKANMQRLNDLNRAPAHA